jgi:drug/metabolite transporter (DMT)-like permease
MRTTTYALLALLAFAANNVLCRLALQPHAIDAATFSSVRLATGAATLLLLDRGHRRSGFRLGGSWRSAACLFLYAIPFSFAYVSLSAGTGALVLFGAVQITMMLAALRAGERPEPRQWLGFLMAVGGLVYLVLPGLAAPSPAGAALMALAGVGWGLYSLQGRGAANPLADTSGNFVRATPFVLAVNVLTAGSAHADANGVVLASASGTVASGLGYFVWYAALRHLTATRAAVVQLAVPILAAAGGALLLDEAISARLIVSAALVLGGIAAALAGRERRSLPDAAPGHVD